MNRLRLVFLVLPLIYLIFTPNAFPEQYTRWGLPAGAKARLGKGEIQDIKYFPDGNKIRKLCYHAPDRSTEIDLDKTS